MDEKVEKILGSAARLFESADVSGVKVRELAKRDLGELLEAHMAITGVIQSSIERKNGAAGKTSDSIGQRLLLMGTFVHGISIIEKCVCEGFYFQAAALLRQALETIAAIDECVIEQRKSGTAPNVRNVRWELCSLHGPLSELTHVSKETVLSAIVGLDGSDGAKPVTFSPVYRPDLAWNLYGLQVALLVQAAINIDALHNDMFGEGLPPAEWAVIATVIDTLLSVGWLKENAS